MPEWIGKTIGKVQVEKLLARGGMAEVYLATHITLARPMAVKLLHSYIEEEPVLLERFQREARVVAALRHPNIVQIFDFDTIEGHPYIVMEYLKGPTLATYLRQLHQRKKRSPHPQIARLLNGLAAALDYAHGRGVIHRDIKPANILLHNKTGEFPLDKPLPDDVEAVVTDFGLVRLVDATSHTTSGMLSGTPLYMSREQALGEAIDHRTDIYSLGIVLYEMVAGRLPFQAENTLTILHMHAHMTPPAIPGIPAKVQEVIDRALQKNPDDRYQTSRELANDFSRAIGMTPESGSIQAPTPVRPVPIEPPVTVLPTSVSLPADLLELLSHDNSSVRKLAVKQLVALLDDKQLGLARAAQEKLREIATTDDSLTVRRIATQELSARGLEAGLSAPEETLQEKPLEKPAIPAQETVQEKEVEKPRTPPKEPVQEKEVEKTGTPQKDLFFLALLRRLKDLNPLPRLRASQFVLPKLDRRLVIGILSIALGFVVLVGAREFLVNRTPVSTPTATITITATERPASTPSLTMTPQRTETSSPTPVPTVTPTLSPTPTSTSSPTRTPLPPAPEPTRRRRETKPPQG